MMGITPIASGGNVAPGSLRAFEDIAKVSALVWFVRGTGLRLSVCRK